MPSRPVIKKTQPKHNQERRKQLASDQSLYQNRQLSHERRLHSGSRSLAELPKRKQLVLGYQTSWDTETTGVDLFHGARPFLVTTTNNKENTTWWEWDVNPLDRTVQVHRSDLQEIQDEIDQSEVLILQNTKFDYGMLRETFRDHGYELRWDWVKVRDTLFAGHMLNSVAAHDLTTMVLMYLGVNLQPFEDQVKTLTNEARKYCHGVGKLVGTYPEWRLAKPGLEEMPSAKGTVWKLDMWLPRAIAKHEKLPEDHPYWTTCSNYANPDSQSTILLWERLWELIQERGLQRIYSDRMRLLPVIPAMEEHGVTVIEDNLQKLQEQFTAESEMLGQQCIRLAASVGYELVIPKSGNNNSLKSLLFGPEAKLPLPVVARSKKTNEPTLNKQAIEAYIDILPERSKQKLFVKALASKRKRDTAISYMDGYRRFWLPQVPGYYLIHPSLNPTGTNTLRGSSANPNEQNISKQDGSNLRCTFGPAPGRCWVSLDYENIELRIPGYESGEEAMIELFEKPDEPPYFGSYHLLNASIVYPEQFWPLADEKGAFKDKYKASFYRWVKNGGFAIQYGCQEPKADATFKKAGAYRAIKEKLPKIAALNDYWIKQASVHGYVETIPDKEIDPTKGYPVYCKRSDWGSVSPTIPLNYHVQSTAMWVIWRAMVKIYDYFQTLDEDWKLIMQVHDEVVIDFSLDCDYIPVLQHVKALMEGMGEAISVPLTVGVEVHPNHWGESMDLSTFSRQKGKCFETT